MPGINDRDRHVFSEAEKTTLQNFTVDELTTIHRMALELDAIVKAAIDREHKSFGSNY